MARVSRPAECIAGIDADGLEMPYELSAGPIVKSEAGGLETVSTADLEIGATGESSTFVAARDCGYFAGKLLGLIDS